MVSYISTYSVVLYCALVWMVGYVTIYPIVLYYKRKARREREREEFLRQPIGRVVSIKEDENGGLYAECQVENPEVLRYMRYVLEDRVSFGPFETQKKER